MPAFRSHQDAPVTTAAPITASAASPATAAPTEVTAQSPAELPAAKADEIERSSRLPPSPAFAVVGTDSREDHRPSRSCLNCFSSERAVLAVWKLSA